MVVVISGPSGVGKSTICRRLLGRIPDAFLSVSCTTRTPGPGEVDGKDYWFIDRQQFEDGIRSGRFLEYAEVFGNLYGTPREPIQKAIQQGKVVVLEIDVQGGSQVKKVFPEAVLIFIMPPKEQALEDRLFGRAREDKATMERRLQQARKEIDAARRLYDHFVVNDELDKAVDEIVTIIEDRRRAVRSGLVEKSDDRGTQE